MDLCLEKQILETNQLGNVLLSGLISEIVTGNNKNKTINVSLKNLQEAISMLKYENNKLKAVKIGVCSDVLEKNENSNCHSQVVLLCEELLKKIDSILKNHVKCNESSVITQDEVNALKTKRYLFVSVQEELTKIPNSRKELQSHLKIVEVIKANIQQIIDATRSSKTKVEDIQDEVIRKSSDQLYFFNKSI